MTPQFAALPDAALIEDYMRGQCHIHAIASVRAHGGGFAICYDHSEPYFQSEDGDEDVSSVVHVWSIHETPDGLVARDIFGDFPANEEEMVARLSAFFPAIKHRFKFGDADIDDQGTLQELLDLSGDEDHQPLGEITEDDIAIAAILPSVTAVPGRNMAPSVELISARDEDGPRPT